MTTITDKKQYPGEQYLNELITNMEFAARAPVEVVRAMAAELQKRREADGAEPVAWVMADDLRDNAIVSTPAYPCLDDAKERTIGSLIALYAAPPVPVIQADVAQAIETLKQKLVECNRYNYCADAVKGVEDACHAAMLHGAEPVSQTYKSQHTQFEQVADLYEMQFDDGRTCAFHTDAQKAAQWLQACDGNRVQEYVKLERLRNALSGNSPVAPDGLLGCGENCWSCGKYFTYEQHYECDGYCPHCNSPVDLDDEEDQPSKVVPTNPTEEMISNAWREAIGKCDHETIKRIYATMLAAAPQQEVN